MAESTHDESAALMDHRLWWVTGSIVREYTEGADQIQVSEPHMYLVAAPGLDAVKDRVMTATKPATFIINSVTQMMHGVAEVTVKASAEITNPSAEAAPELAGGEHG